ncbi:MAG: hypothetical protein QNJ49_21090, partial [Mastigocoleus sp. MO_167.B18]|nr:hypothetical protein [Mastigocoleus sp. MO_167.B18]
IYLAMINPIARYCCFPVGDFIGCKVVVSGCFSVVLAIQAVFFARWEEDIIASYRPLWEQELVANLVWQKK